MQVVNGEEERARVLLRKCVHCGFCNSACPTYGELADEQNGPRGRIWQMKAFMDGDSSAAVNLANLDLCLTCGACQSACPSGVEYLAAHDIVKPLMERRLRRGWRKKIMRSIALAVLPHPRRVRPVAMMAKAFGILKLPPVAKSQTMSQTMHAPAEVNKDEKAASAILYDGCVQSAAAPGINRHAINLLGAVGINAAEEKGVCCGALQMHLGDEEKGKARIRNNVDILHRRLEGGAKRIVSTASGCGRMVASYGRLLADDKEYADKAKQVSAAHLDIGALLSMQDCSTLKPADDNNGGAVFHCPCTLAHGEGADGGAAVMKVLTAAGVKATMPPPVCCGSAGFYSYENPAMATTLRDKRLEVLREDNPAAIFTANIGCQMHLQNGTKTPIRHWTDLLQPR